MPPILSFHLAEKKERAPGGIACCRCRWQKKGACNFRSVFQAPQGGILRFSAAAELVDPAVFSLEATIVPRRIPGKSKRGSQAPFGRLNEGESREGEKPEIFPSLVSFSLVPFFWTGGLSSEVQHLF